MRVTITRIERDAYKEATVLKKAKRYRGRGIFDKVFTEEYGKAIIFSPNNIKLARKLEKQKQHDKKEADLQKQLEKERKQKLKEERERLTAQRRQEMTNKKAKAIEDRLQREMIKATITEERENALTLKKQKQAMERAKKHDKKQSISATKVVLSSEAQNAESGPISVVRTSGRQSKPSQHKLGLDFA